MDGSHVSPQLMMSLFLDALTRSTPRRHVENSAKWRIPTVWKGQPSMLWARRGSVAEFPANLPALAFLNGPFEPGTLIAVYRDHERLPGQQLCLATSEGFLHVPGDQTKVAFNATRPVRAHDSNIRESRITRLAADLVAVTEALYYERPVPDAEQTVLVAGPVWGLWRDERHVRSLGDLLRGRNPPVSEPSVLTDAGMIWLRAYHRSMGNEIYGPGAPRKEGPVVKVGNNSIVSLVGDNAQAVTVGQNANAVIANTTDAELIGTIVAALRAADRIEDAEMLEGVAADVGPRHPATARVGKRVWKGAKEVLTATVPAATTAMFKALIGL